MGLELLCVSDFGPSKVKTHCQTNTKVIKTHIRRGTEATMIFFFGNNAECLVRDHILYLEVWTCNTFGHIAKSLVRDHVLENRQRPVRPVDISDNL